MSDLSIDVGADLGGFDKATASAVGHLNKLTAAEKKNEKASAGLEKQTDDTTEAFEDFGDITDLLPDSLAGVGDSLSSIKGLLGSAGGVATLTATALLAVGAGAIAIADSTAQATFEMDRLAQSAGVTLQEFSSLRVMMDRTELEGDDLIDLFAELRIVALEAADGDDELADSLARLGIASEDPLERMGEFAEAIRRASGDQKRLAELSLIYGEDLVRKMTPALAGGAKGLKDMREEAESFGLVIGKEAQKEALEYEKRILQLSHNFGGLTKSIGEGVIPVLNSFLSIVTTIETDEEQAFNRLKARYEGADVEFRKLVISQIKGRISIHAVQAQLLQMAEQEAAQARKDAEEREAIAAAELQAIADKQAAQEEADEAKADGQTAGMDLALAAADLERRLSDEALRVAEANASQRVALAQETADLIAEVNQAATDEWVAGMQRALTQDKQATEFRKALALDFAATSLQVAGDLAQSMADKGRISAVDAFKISQATALAQVAINSALAFASTFAQAPGGVGAKTVQAAAAAAIVGAQAIPIIAAEPPQVKHQGGVIAGAPVAGGAPSEVMVRAQRGEAVIDRATTRAAGGHGGLMDRIRGGQAQQAVIVTDRRVVARASRQDYIAGGWQSQLNHDPTRNLEG